MIALLPTVISFSKAFHQHPPPTALVPAPLRLLNLEVVTPEI